MANLNVNEHTSFLSALQSTPPRFLNQDPFPQTLRFNGSPSLLFHTPSPRRSPLKKSPSPLAKNVKRRSSASTSLFGSFVRSMKIKPKKGGKSPRRSGSIFRMRSMPGISRWAEISPKRERHRLIDERRKQRATGGSPRRVDDAMTVDNQSECGDEDMELGPAQFLPAMWHAGSRNSLDPFKTPPCTPTEDVYGTVDAPLLYVDNTPDSMRSRKRAERSRMKSLQILGPEASGAVREKWEKAGLAL